MSQISHEPQTPENSRPDAVPDGESGGARPFDNSGLQDIPQPRTDDPPYRNWWAIEAGSDRAPTGWNNRDKSG